MNYSPSFLKRMKRKAKKLISYDPFYYLKRNVIELNNVQELMKIYGWRLSPILDDPIVDEFNNVEDVNGRRRKDYETLATIVRNINPKVCLDIGTATGHSAALMAVNAECGKVFTVNAPPEEILSGQSGKDTTMVISREQIGSYYRERNLRNIEQIYANTARWKPNIGKIDVAFIDGCHDTKFVYNDTRLILPHLQKTAFLVWHDFNPGQTLHFPWINSVCLGVEKLYENGYLNNYLFHIKDSWIGIYCWNELK